MFSRSFVDADSILIFTQLRMMKAGFAGGLGGTGEETLPLYFKTN
jgi:hypothetical protein